MVKRLSIIREIFKGDHNAAAARKLMRNQISALSGTLNYINLFIHSCFRVVKTITNIQLKRKESSKTVKLYVI